MKIIHKPQSFEIEVGDFVLVDGYMRRRISGPLQVVGATDLMFKYIGNGVERKKRKSSVLVVLKGAHTGEVLEKLKDEYNTIAAQHDEAINAAGMKCASEQNSLIQRYVKTA